MGCEEVETFDVRGSAIQKPEAFTMQVGAEIYPEKHY
jgi:hypothetical protein